MAKMTPGAIVSEIRGKIASTVWSRNKAGAVIRNRVTPINRRSVLQTQLRQELSALAQSWRGLTDAQRASWNSLAQQLPQSDNLGQTIFVSGEDMYVRCNANRIVIGEDPDLALAPAPTSFPVLQIGALTVSAAGGTFTAAFTPDPVPTGMALVIRATAPQSAGKTFVSPSLFRQIQVEDAADTSPADLATNYIAKFGALTNVAGSRIFVEMFLVEVASGLAGQKVRASVIIGA